MTRPGVDAAIADNVVTTPTPPGESPVTPEAMRAPSWDAAGRLRWSLPARTGPRALQDPGVDG